MNPKYQVFISSTYSDLVEERESIIKAILEIYHIPIGMEMFSAEDEDQWEVIRRTIEISDYYILVLGLRYGSKASDGISFTQKEYEYALEKKIPVLAFVIDEMAALPKNKRDDDLTEMNNFRELVLKNSKMAQFWKSKEELTKNVSISLLKQIMQKPGIGWVRGDKLDSEEALSKELASISKENRQLREKISELELRVSPKKPEILVTIKAPTVDEEFDSFEKLVMPKKIDMNDIDMYLQEFISRDDIEKYNASLPNQLEIDLYNEELDRQYKREKYSIPLDVNVSNVGTVKANNLFIDITFPKGFSVYRKNKQFEELKNPLPLNPIQQAKKEYVKRSSSLIQNRAWDSHFYDSLRHDEILNPEIFTLDRLNTVNQNVNFGTVLKGNKLTIRLNSLLHTRCKAFDDQYMIVPLTKETHQIPVEIICEEYQEIDIQTIEITV